MATKTQNEQFYEDMGQHYTLDDAIDWIQSYTDPADVFTEAQLETWALANGFKKEQDKGES